MAQIFVKKNHKSYKKIKRAIGSVTILIGLGVLIYFFFPVVSYNIFLGGGSDIVTPVPKYTMIKSDGLGSLLTQGIANLSTNFYDARNWYPEVRADGKASAPIYFLSIPKLNIEDAEVSTTDYDLSKHLIQYSDTSIPGENGTAIVFGHSTLPNWFNPRDYKTIFATLHTIKNGDEIIARVDGDEHIFKVFSVTVTSPEDTNMFSQSFDNSYLTVITCTPPGTVWKRLIVRAALAPDAKLSLDIK